MSHTGQYRFTEEVEARKLNANLKIRFEDSDKPIFVSRELLSICSNVFRVMLNGDWQEKNAGEIKLGVNREDFLSFLECLYLPPAPITSRNFKTVATISDRYDCPYLLFNCKEFAEDAVRTMPTIGECKDLIEIAERLGWQDIMIAAVHVDLIVDLLDYEWMIARKKTTVNLLFARMMDLLPLHTAFLFLRSNTPTLVPTTSRFTDEAQALERYNSKTKVLCYDSDEPVFINLEYLTIYCKVFRAMVEQDFKEEEIKLDVKREEFLSFLDCLHVPCANVTPYNFKVVLMVADHYGCQILLDNCKKFAENEASKANTVDDCKDYIEVAEHLGWHDLAVVEMMKRRGVNFFMELLKDEWIDERKPSTQQALYEGLKEVVRTHLN